MKNKEKFNYAYQVVLINKTKFQERIIKLNI